MKHFFIFLFLVFSLSAIAQVDYTVPGSYVHPTSGIKPAVDSNQILITKPYYSANRLQYEQVLFDLSNDSLRLTKDIRVDLSGLTTAAKKDSSVIHPYLRKFRNTLSGDFEIVLFGDSRTADYTTGLQLLDRLSEQYSYGGFGYVGFGDANPSFIGGVNNGGVVNDNALSGLQSTSGLSLTLDANGDDYTINTSTTKGEFSQIDIWYYQQSGGGDFTITIDGTLNQTVATAGTASVQKISITGLADSIHNIVFEKTAGGDVDLLEMYLKKSSGFVLNIVGNSGSNTDDFVNEVTNRHFFQDKQPDLVIIRLGVNGNDIDAPQTGATNHLSITNSILAVSSGTQFIWTGEPDNGSVEDTKEDIQNYNSVLFGKADSNNVAFADMFELIPDWPSFNSEGYGDAVTHENTLGGYILADWYHDFIFNRLYESPIVSGINTGTIDKLAYYTAADQVSSASSIYSDGTKIGINTTGNGVGKLNVFNNNGTVAALGAGSNGNNPFFTINDKSGYVDLTWFGKYDGSNYLSTIALTPVQIKKTSNSIGINFGDPTTTGQPISWVSNFSMNRDGLLSLSGYSASRFATINSGTTHSYPVFDSNGALRPRTAAEFIAPFNLVEISTFTGTNKKIVSFGTGASGVNPFFSINDIGGYSYLSTMSRYDSDSSAFVSTISSVRPMRRYRNADTYFIDFADVTTSGTVVDTWRNVFYISQGGNMGIGSNSSNGSLVFNHSKTSLYNSLISMNDEGFNFNLTNNNRIYDFELGGVSELKIGKTDITTLNNVGIGTETPDAKLDVEGGNVRFSDYGGGTVTGTETYLLGVDVDGDVLEVDLNSVGGGGNVSANLTANYMPVAFNADSLINSAMYQDGTSIGIGTTTPASKLHVSTVNGEVNRLTTTGTSGGWQVYTENSSIRGYVGFNLFNAEATDAFGLFSENDLVFKSVGTLHDIKFKTGPRGAGSVVSMLIDGADGSITMNQYGSHTFTGTRASGLAVDASGNLIENNIHRQTLNHGTTSTSASGAGNEEAIAISADMAGSVEITVTHSLFNASPDASTSFILEKYPVTGSSTIINTVVIPANTKVGSATFTTTVAEGDQLIVSGIANGGSQPAGLKSTIEIKK